MLALPGAVYKVHLLTIEQQRLHCCRTCMEAFPRHCRLCTPVPALELSGSPRAAATLATMRICMPNTSVLLSQYSALRVRSATTLCCVLLKLCTPLKLSPEMLWEVVVMPGRPMEAKARAKRLATVSLGKTTKRNSTCFSAHCCSATAWYCCRMLTPCKQSFHWPPSSCL